MPDRKTRIACHILAYNVDLFIEHTLRNCAPHVDKVYVMYPSRPWGYRTEAREGRVNPTSREFVQQAIAKVQAELPSSPEFEIIDGDWELDEDTRNAALNRARSEGFEWLLIQDADEFYTPQAWALLLNTIKVTKADCIRTSWYIFWKSPQVVIEHYHGSIKDNNVGFALRCSEEIKFQRSRTSNTDNIELVDASCYHYAYVMSDDTMYEKITSWGHSHQFNPNAWYKRKWLRWTLASRNLHPVHPEMWRRAVRFPNEQPEFAKEFNLPVNLDAQPTAAETLAAVAETLKLRLLATAKIARNLIQRR